MSSYKVIVIQGVTQNRADMSFRGGSPNMPTNLDLPHCKQCDEEMAFYFQLAFPAKHVWNGWVMCFFHCTCCYNVDEYWPHVAYGYPYIDLPDGYVDDYQTNFRVLVFRNSEPVEIRTDAKKILVFEKLEFEPVNPKSKLLGVTKVGGKPAWYYANDPDEYKKMTYMDGGFVFLMQIERDWKFTPLPGVPPQSWDIPEAYEKTPRYFLFNGPPLYFLGTTSPRLDPPRVLVIAQRS